ncbi:MAG: DUF4835 family protein [Saprospiraceae bacterium]|uniref:DUF4835 family protein n=1 Tax=Candidatus Opimibacter skivensis TaxID=2982028 RepID=A0A9D7XLY8_9BACT|nr:DUF4835 family protein [Candidatus Opimibacter skivensis]
MERINILFLLICCFIFGLSSVTYAQELNAVVGVSVPKLQSTDPAVFKTLERDLKEFLNQEKWTDDDYKPYEKIECNFQVNITAELGNNSFKADIAIKAIRPVYGSEYKTVLINHVDRDIVFTYQEFAPIENGTEIFKDNLSGVFSFYAHLILGLDAESFALGAGDAEFQKAQSIINIVPPTVSDSDKGWTALSRKTTRYWIMENLLNTRFKSFKEAWYNYHRKSLDVLHSNPGLALSTMVEALKEVDKTNTSYPNSIGVLMFVSAKSDEVVEILKNGDRTQKNAVYDIMRKLDPSNSGKYSAIRG